MKLVEVVETFEEKRKPLPPEVYGVEILMSEGTWVAANGFVYPYTPEGLEAAKRDAKSRSSRVSARVVHLVTE